jgi:hypothetical protein
MAQIGKFPKRAKPISKYSEIDSKGRFPTYDKLNEEIEKYQLALCKPSTYVLRQHKDQDQGETPVRNFARRIVRSS